MEETQFDRAEALFGQFDLTDLSPDRWRIKLQEFADRGEDPAVLKLLENSLQANWLEQISERLAALPPGGREAELQTLLDKELLSAAAAGRLHSQLNELQAGALLLRPGMSIDKYVLGEPLYTPEDGLSLVYHARQGDLPRVIKFIHPRRLVIDNSDAKEQFKQELQHLQALDGIQGIVSVIDWGFFRYDETGVLPFLVTHYIRDGLPITAYAKRNGLAATQRLELFARVCDAVRAAHGKGIVHRDLKPGNILVDQSGQTWVIDFGLAHAWRPWLAADIWAPSPGSRQYMSPEHVAPGYGAVGFHSDVYALGLILYELLSDEKPYVVSSPADITEAAPALIGTQNTLYRHSALEKQLARALAKQPQERCSLQELQAVAIAYRPAQTAAQESPPTPVMPQRRRMLWGMGIAGLIVCTLAGGLLLFSRDNIVLAGIWFADVRYPWGIQCREQFEFELYGSELQGRASFLGVPRALFEGRVDSDTIGFVTHTREIAAGGAAKTATRRYSGRISADHIAFIMISEGGYSESLPAEFIAKKTALTDNESARRCVSVR